MRSRAELPRAPWREVGALIVLPVAPFIVPVFVGWFVGVLLLWSSKAWTTRDKLIGTLVPLAGLALLVRIGAWKAFLLPIGLNLWTVPRNSPPAGPPAWGHVLPGVVGLLLIALPFLTAAYLARRLGKRPA